ncbi:hypothetical protein GOP47_0024964 [Adiantum capillus-veneris]|uniref:Uncharacterized protein n=1 Tax=Adiantum capillus-veneris TaxID=13818 RepID=A0A9D4U2S2_ADICA|nr:hypothetical protein GOP47_0024964 [Adiantum capillus-veneris]
MLDLNVPWEAKQVMQSIDLNVTWKAEGDRGMPGRMEARLDAFEDGEKQKQYRIFDLNEELEEGSSSSTGSSSASMESGSHSSGGDQVKEFTEFPSTFLADSIHRRKPVTQSFDPELHASHHFFSFSRESYDLMLLDLQGICKPTLGMLHNVGMHDVKRWNKMKDNLVIRGSPRHGSVRIFLKGLPPRAIAPKEEWTTITEQCHVDQQGAHLSMLETMNQMKTAWCTDIKRHGIPTSFIRDAVRNCQVCKKDPILQSESLMFQKVGGKGKAGEKTPSEKNYYR